MFQWTEDGKTTDIHQRKKGGEREVDDVWREVLAKLCISYESAQGYTGLRG